MLWPPVWPLPYFAALIIGSVYRLKLDAVVAGIGLAVVMAACVNIFGYSVRKSAAGKTCPARRLYKIKAIEANWNGILHFTPINQAVSGFVPTLLCRSLVALVLRQSNQSHFLS